MPRTEKALLIHGPVYDLADLLAIARAEGKKLLRTDKVRVLPFVTLLESSAYLVVVEKDGCSKTSGVESGKNRG